MYIGNKIKILRKYYDYYQKKLADKIGVDKNTISRWEKGKRQPSPKHRQKLAKLFGIHEGDLISDNAIIKGDTFAERLKIARKTKGITREQFSKDLNIRIDTLREAEGDTIHTSYFSQAILFKICDYLNVDFKDLLGDDFEAWAGSGGPVGDPVNLLPIVSDIPAFNLKMKYSPKDVFNHKYDFVILNNYRSETHFCLNIKNDILDKQNIYEGDLAVTEKNSMDRESNHVWLLNIPADNGRVYFTLKEIIFIEKGRCVVNPLNGPQSAREEKADITEIDLTRSFTADIIDSKGILTGKTNKGIMFKFAGKVVNLVRNL